MSHEMGHAGVVSNLFKMKTFNRKYLKQRRRYLRNKLTSAEATLWKALQSSQLEGRKFRRQAGIGNYIVDFYCPREKLVLELDGNYHLEMINSEYDTPAGAPF